MLPWESSHQQKEVQHSSTRHLLTFGEMWSWRTWHSDSSIQTAVMPEVRKPAMSWFWVVHLLWNKTPASSWSYEKRGRKRSSQELELSLAYVGYNNEQSKISTSQPYELGFGQTRLSTEWLECRTWELGKPVSERRRQRKAETVPKPRLRTGN